ncbi:hypothetical protein AGLY_003462 [Aphis glycines]|uniref:Uncharacterized protein n=1 Tax=Aphis glycines TaxID=307491 RepID=A0A6G0TZR6_APHGL|nr:hypothetical protein AGLY_003462 [Aphis glycines]
MHIHNTIGFLLTKIDIIHFPVATSCPLKLDRKISSLKLYAYICKYKCPFDGIIKYNNDKIATMVLDSIQQRLSILDSERSDERIDFTMIRTNRNNASISNFGDGFRRKSVYPWCIIKVKIQFFTKSVKNAKNYKYLKISPVIKIDSLHTTETKIVRLWMSVYITKILFKMLIYIIYSLFILHILSEIIPTYHLNTTQKLFLFNNKKANQYEKIFVSKSTRIMMYTIILVDTKIIDFNRLEILMDMRTEINFQYTINLSEIEIVLPKSLPTVLYADKASSTSDRSNILASSIQASMSSGSYSMQTVWLDNSIEMLVHNHSKMYINDLTPMDLLDQSYKLRTANLHQVLCH